MLLQSCVLVVDSDTWSFKGVNILKELLLFV